jgi:hypothetical protein
MPKGKKASKVKKTSKKKINLPKKVVKGQITKKELKPVGMLTSDGDLKSSAPVEAISGVGTIKGRHLRKEGVETVGDYKKSFALFFKEKKAKKKVKVKPKVKAKPKAKSGYYLIESDTGKIITKKLHESESQIKQMSGVRRGTLVYVKARTKKEAEKKFWDKLGKEFKPKVEPKKTSLGQFESKEAYEKAIEEQQKKIHPVLREKKVKAPRKGNDYVIGKLSEDFIARPNFPEDWKNEKGKVLKSRLKKHADSVIEAEYGKDSEEAKKMRKATKLMNGEEIYAHLVTWVDNYPLEFPHESSSNLSEEDEAEMEIQTHEGSML